jgi:hypothetical protein
MKTYAALAPLTSIRIGMGTVAVYYPTYGSRIRHTNTVSYEPLEELSTVRVAVRLIPYNK